MVEQRVKEAAVQIDFVACASKHREYVEGGRSMRAVAFMEPRRCREKTFLTLKHHASIRRCCAMTLVPTTTFTAYPRTCAHRTMVDPRQTSAQGCRLRHQF